MQRPVRTPGGDVRDFEKAAAEGNADSALALDVFTYQVKKMDAVAFTGGIGENSAKLRSACCEGLEFLGLRLDPGRNERGTGDRIVSAVDSPVSVVALATNEELVVARRACARLTG